MIQPLSDMDHWGVVDRWDIPADGYGDCEDYVLTKREALIKLGVPQTALRITVVFAPHFVRHAVLTVATDKGNLVLDNLRDGVKPWSATPYKFVKRQSQTNPNLWVSIGEQAHAPAVVATR